MKLSRKRLLRALAAALLALMLLAGMCALSEATGEQGAGAGAVSAADAATSREAAARAKTAADEAHKDLTTAQAAAATAKDAAERAEQALAEAAEAEEDPVEAAAAARRAAAKDSGAAKKALSAAESDAQKAAEAVEAARQALEAAQAAGQDTEALEYALTAAQAAADEAQAAVEIAREAADSAEGAAATAKEAAVLAKEAAEGELEAAPQARTEAVEAQPGLGERIHATAQRLIADLEWNFQKTFIDGRNWERQFLAGLKNTMIITGLSLLLGLFIGTIIAAIRSTYDKTAQGARPTFGRKVFGVLNGFCKLYLTVLRGTPVMVQLMIIVFIIFKYSDNGVMLASLAFGLNSGAYVAEIIRGGIMSIDNGQFEAGRSLGFNYLQTMWKVVLPQVIKNVLPSLMNEFIALLKETSVAGYAAVHDLTYGANTVSSATYNYFFPLISVALVYLILVMFFTWIAGMVERRLRNSDH